MKDRILALDPSGAYNEGKGTTGICLLNALTGVIITTNRIEARDHVTQMSYWKEHAAWIQSCHDAFPGQLALVMEDYLIYASRADSHINSHMETSQLIGYLKMVCDDLQIPVTMQRACDVKNRWSNTILERKGILFRQGRSLAVQTEDGPKRVCLHEVDALRHALHFHHFKNR